LKPPGKRGDLKPQGRKGRKDKKILF